MKERTPNQIMLTLLNNELNRMEKRLEKIETSLVAPKFQEIHDLNNELLVKLFKEC